MDLAIANQNGIIELFSECIGNGKYAKICTE